MLFIFYTPIASIFVCATSWWALPPLHAAVSFDDPQLVNFVFMYIVTAVFGMISVPPVICPRDCSLRHGSRSARGPPPLRCFTERHGRECAQGEGSAPSPRLASPCLGCAAFLTGVMVLVLLVMHAWLAGKNLTTIEFLRMQDTDSNPYPYDAGCLNNVEQRFGTAWLTWPLPIKPSVDAHRGGSLV